jgi:hypothetical protein
MDMNNEVYCDLTHTHIFPLIGSVSHSNDRETPHHIVHVAALRPQLSPDLKQYTYGKLSPSQIYSLFSEPYTHTNSNLPLRPILHACTAPSHLPGVPSPVALKNDQGRTSP